MVSCENNGDLHFIGEHRLLMSDLRNEVKDFICIFI